MARLAMRILIVEDDERSADYLIKGLSESGHVVDGATDGETGLAQALEGVYDMLVLDRLLPGLDGLELVHRLRKNDADLPVLMISALATARDKADGLRAGCDDYLAKPYAFAELLARIDALQRRGNHRHRGRFLQVGDLVLDLELRSARRSNRPISLHYREFLLLQALMRRQGQVVTRSMLLEAAWDYRFEPRGNIIDMHVHRLRRKLEQGSEASLIRTIAGAGYMILAAGDGCERLRQS